MLEISKNQNEILDDVNFHLNSILRDCERMKLEHNRNIILVHSFNNIKERLQTIIQLMLVANSSTFVELANQVNKLFTIDTELSKVIIVITNHKRNITNQKTGKLNLDYGFNS
jgi:hypothetical protein